MVSSTDRIDAQCTQGAPSCTQPAPVHSNSPSVLWLMLGQICAHRAHRAHRAELPGMLMCEIGEKEKKEKSVIRRMMRRVMRRVIRRRKKKEGRERREKKEMMIWEGWGNHLRVWGILCPRPVLSLNIIIHIHHLQANRHLKLTCYTFTQPPQNHFSTTITPHEPPILSLSTSSPPQLHLSHPSFTAHLILFSLSVSLL